MKRITAREFQRTFAKIEEPVLVGDGIWFPEVNAALMGIGETFETTGTYHVATDPVPLITNTATPPPKGHTTTSVQRREAVQTGLRYGKDLQKKGQMPRD